MSRLIDAERFKRFLQALCKAGAPYDDVIQLLDKEPIAYDVEKVVAELQDLRKVILDDTIGSYCQSTITKAIDIVRKGGVE